MNEEDQKLHQKAYMEGGKSYSDGDKIDNNDYRKGCILWKLFRLGFNIRQNSLKKDKNKEGQNTYSYGCKCWSIIYCRFGTYIDIESGLTHKEAKFRYFAVMMYEPDINWIRMAIMPADFEYQYTSEEFRARQKQTLQFNKKNSINPNATELEIQPKNVKNTSAIHVQGRLKKSHIRIKV